MKRFRFDRPKDLQAAARALGDDEQAVIKAGGVDLLDRMKERVTNPDRVIGLVDVGDDARAIRLEGDVLRIGALATLSEIASSELILQGAPSVAEAASHAASPLIRNRATIAGNLCQRTRCGYYRHEPFACFRRGASACSAREEGAVQDMHAVFQNDPCASAHPSSLAPPLMALDATLHLVDAAGKASTQPLRSSWHDEVVREREEDLALPEGAVIVGVSVPVQDVSTGRVDAYEEIRQRAAFDWAFVTCGVRIVREGPKVDDVTIYLGAVAPRPWRASAAEAALRGKPFNAALAAEAASLAVEGATPLPGNRYKLPLVKAAVRRALERAWERS